MKKILFTSLIALFSTFANANIFIEANTPITWHPRAIYNALTTVLGQPKDFDFSYGDPLRLEALILNSQPRSANELCKEFLACFYSVNLMPPVGCTDFIDIVIDKNNQLYETSKRIEEITGLEPYQQIYWDTSLSKIACEYAAHVMDINVTDQCEIIQDTLKQYITADANTYFMSISEFVQSCSNSFNNIKSETGKKLLFLPERINEFCFAYLDEYANRQNEQISYGNYNIDRITRFEIDNNNNNNNNNKEDNTNKKDISQDNIDHVEPTDQRKKDIERQITDTLKDIYQLDEYYKDPDIMVFAHEIEAKLQQKPSKKELEALHDKAITLEFNALISTAKDYLDPYFTDSLTNAQKFMFEEWESLEHQRQNYLDYLNSITPDDIQHYSLEQKKNIIIKAKEISDSMYRLDAEAATKYMQR